ncbi:hypothetical protein [Streptomyces montanisoli]|uniref:Uncharacterized protein n=1 Tax=Streptomyces montanisoli TaxID=2798581 RepID=A0A940RX52_9ACTN|nr:hypothetical protein [Streptomyces montanisoli]MBP0460837.1 hypothetical protein [Streptomyces montanisoli]
MKIILAVCTALGGALPLVALVWGWLLTRRDFRKLVADLDAIDAVIHAPDTDYPGPGGKSAAMEEIRTPEANWGRITYTFEWVQRMILKQALEDLTGPAWLALVGLIVGTTAGVWSIWA